MTSDKLQHQVCKLFQTQNFVLYNISKLLSNPNGGKYHGGYLKKMAAQTRIFVQKLRF